MADNVTINITEVIDDVSISVSQIGEQGVPGPIGPAGAAGNTVTITTSENITLGDVVNSDGTKADSAIVGKREWIVGIASETSLSGFPCDVVVIGDATNVSWTWVAGNVIYLNGTSLSTTPPSSGFIKRIGTASSGTVIEVNIGTSILI